MQRRKSGQPHKGWKKAATSSHVVKITPDDQIKREFDSRELSYIDAIQALQNLGWQSEDAEDTVTEWEQDWKLIAITNGERS